MRFKLEYLSTGTVPYVLAHQVDKGDFRVGPDSRLAGVRIKCQFATTRTTTRRLTRFDRIFL